MNHLVQLLHALFPPLWLAAYLCLLAVIALFGLHRLYLVALYRRHRHDTPAEKPLPADPPPVTVQLPMFHEPPALAQRVIDAACRFDYPAHKLQIQVLDDTTDPRLAERTRQHVARWRKQGLAIDYRHRRTRRGYKAGALADALPEATGRLIAIFDADFVPPPDFLRRTVGLFDDPGLALVQTRWTHRNRDRSRLTRLQAMLLDGHFSIEHIARACGSGWMSFNGTAGIWRREAIRQAGGWSNASLTEDLDLSCRAQAAGWRFAYLPTVACPAELPETMAALKSQQYRWTKGLAQTARRMLPSLLRSRVSPRRKCEAIFHLTRPAAALALTGAGLLLGPTVFLTRTAATPQLLVLANGLLALAGIGTITFYIVSETANRHRLLTAILRLPALLMLGTGLALNASFACLAGLRHRGGRFVRTPKTGQVQNPSPEPDPLSSRRQRHAAFELILAAYMLACTIYLTTHTGPIALLTAPWPLLFAAGYTYTGATTIAPSLPRRRQPNQHITTADTQTPTVNHATT